MVKRLEAPPTFQDWEVKRAGAGLTILGKLEGGQDWKVTRVAAVRVQRAEAMPTAPAQILATDDQGQVVAYLGVAR